MYPRLAPMDDYEDKPTRLKNTKHLRKIQRKGNGSEEYQRASEGKRPAVPTPKVKDLLRDLSDDDRYWRIDVWDQEDTP